MARAPTENRPGDGRRTRAPSRRRDWFPVAGVAATSLLLNALFAFIVGVPRPFFHDEFSYLLAADTFGAGRLTNPTHPFWQHFETIHVIHQPTYASKYPPGPGLFMAAGRRLAGQPVAGVWLATALASAAITWALAQRLPRRWAAVGGLLAALHPLVLQWSQSYWGGSFAMLGGALLLGGATSLSRRPRPAPAVALATGIALLANTRPFEGCILTALVLLTLSLHLFRRKRLDLKPLLTRAAAPAAAVLLAAVAFMLYYNHRVTGNALKLPYVEHEQQYGLAPLFVFQPEKPRPAYRHAALEQYHEAWAMNQWYRPQRSARGFLAYSMKKLADLALEYRLHTLLAIPLLCGVAAIRRSRRARVALLLLIAFLACLLPATWILPHYVAPAFPILLFLAAAGLRAATHWRWGGYPVGTAIVTTALLFYPAAFAYEAWEMVAPALGARPPTLATILPDQRDAAVQSATQHGDKALIFVRYGPNRIVHYEWVYNAADIDDAPAVWAREISPADDLRLMEYFPQRHVVRLDVAGVQIRLTTIRPPVRR